VAAAPTPLAPLSTIVAHAGVTPNVSTVWVAADLGFDREYGLAIDIHQTRAASVSQAALLAGEIDYAWTGLPPFLSARAGGSDVVFIGATTNKTVAELVVRPPLTTPDDLRGKTFGVQSFGGPPHIRTIAALLKLGIDPARDGVSIITTGDEPTTTAALLEGAIDGAAISYTAAAEPKARGYHTWDIAQLGVPEITGIVTRTSQVREQPEVSRRLLRALAASQRYIRSIGSDTEARRRVGEAVGSRLKTAPDLVLVQLDEIRDSLPADLRIKLDDAREQQALTALVQPDVQGLQVQDWLDQSLLDQLQQEGFFARLDSR
jgi:ABC-type nitrate/sulfonate/bicarbonate transport system substrate-binding protein